MNRTKNYSATIKKVGIVTITFNLILTIIKLVAGILVKSSAMISDAIHSSSDIFTTVIVIVGAKISTKDSDDNHPYGHERFESVASVFLGILLSATALTIGYSGIKSIISFVNSPYTPSKHNILALSVSILSILIKGIMYIYTLKIANNIKSSSLKADALHHLSDSLSSIASMLGIIGLIIGKGWEILDPIAAIIICIILLKLSFGIVKGAFDQLVDSSISSKLTKEIKLDISKQNGVEKIKSFQSRKFGNKMYLDVEIYVKDDLSIIEATNIAENVHHMLEEKYEDIKHCSISPKPLLIERGKDI